MRQKRLALSRTEYESAAGANLARPAWPKPALRPIDWHGARLLVKDYRPCPWFWRLTWGQLMVGRETSIYAALGGVPGIPRFFGTVDRDAFAVERIEGRDLSGYRRGQVSAAFVDRLAGIVRGLHSRGVVHLDLRQRRNVIVGEGEAPFLVDFASAIRLPRGSEILRLLSLLDLSGVAKLRLKHAPETLGEADRRLLEFQLLRPFKRARVLRRAEAKRRRTEPRPADRRHKG